jgi:hypothetical protein
MVPIHDTDVAEERWTKASWDSYELWEKVEVLEKRKRKLWIVATFFFFILLSSVPVAVDQWPKWVTQHLAGRLAREVNQLKREASVARSTFRIRFYDEGKLNFVVEKLNQCSDPKGQVVRSGDLAVAPFMRGYTWISSSQALAMEIPGLVSQFCFDPLRGSEMTDTDKKVAGFGMISVNDLTEKRLDRMALLLLSGPSAEISF